MTLLPHPIEPEDASGSPGRYLVAVPDPATRRSWWRGALIGAVVAVLIAANGLAFRDRSTQRAATDQLATATAAARTHERTMQGQITALEKQYAKAEAEIRSTTAARDQSRRALAALVKNEKGTNTELTAVWAALERQQRELAALDSCLRSAHHALNTVSVWDASHNLAVLDTSRLCDKAGQ